MAIEGISVDELEETIREEAALAIREGYLYREGNMLYTRRDCMIQLHKDEFSCLRPLCHTMKEEIMLQWFLEGNPACYAWTDSLENPKTALILAADGCCFYESYEDFQQKGLGYVVYKETQLVSIASSYNTYQNCIGVTIGTLEEHRGKGIALACASQLILECEEKGICPMWEAANPASVALTQKLGYPYQTEYEICIIM